MDVYETANYLAAEADKDPENKCSTLEFRLIDCKEAGEDWTSYEWAEGLDTHGVCILVNGKELAGDIQVGHMHPAGLLGELTAGITEGTIEFDEGAWIYMCESCGEAGCLNYLCLVRVCEDFVVWQTRNGDFVFRKENYQVEIEKLKQWEEEYRDKREV